MLEEVKNRKKLEYEQKVKALEEELESWSSRSASDGVFEKHHTQIRAVQAHLKPWHASIRNKLAEYEKNDPDVYLSKCANAEKLILSEHRIWDYFRRKFIQRNEESFNLYLKAADEFAWACYKPIQQLVFPDVTNSNRKEPPLVFFNGGGSPFSVSRERSFQAETVAGENLTISPKADIMRLPIPVVGVPWNQVSFLPEVLVVGHEVGHIVEDDFLKDKKGKSTELERLLDEALTEAGASLRKDAWHSWLGEIFADLYGCLAAGTAFAGALIDFLAKGSSQISSEQKNAPAWKRYPTDFLRVSIVLKALEVMIDVMKMNNNKDEVKSITIFEGEVEGYKRLWKNYSSNMPADFTADIDFIVPKLLKDPHANLKGKSIIEVFCFSAEQNKKVFETVEAIRKYKPQRIEDDRVIPGTSAQLKSTDIRVIFAAIRIAYEKYPDEYTNQDYGKIFLHHIKEKVIQKGVRSGELKLTEAQLRDKMRSYEQVGAEMVEELLDL